MSEEIFEQQIMKREKLREYKEEMHMIFEMVDQILFNGLELIRSIIIAKMNETEQDMLYSRNEKKNLWKIDEMKQINNIVNTMIDSIFRFNQLSLDLYEKYKYSKQSFITKSFYVVSCKPWCKKFYSELIDNKWMKFDDEEINELTEQIKI